MNDVLLDFYTREQEVSRFFLFLREFENGSVIFRDDGSDRPSFTSNEQASLLKTLKANAFLLLYNLVESSFKNAIEAIFDELKIRGVSFDICRLEVRKIAIQNLRKHNADRVLPLLTAISVDVVVATFRKDELFSGNVDAKRVREIAGEYGFATPIKNSRQLLTVKRNRNDLAHGDKSFADVGRDYSVDRLDEIRVEVVEYLKELLNNIKVYIDTKAYLAT